MTTITGMSGMTVMAGMTNMTGIGLILDLYFNGIVGRLHICADSYIRFL